MKIFKPIFFLFLACTFLFFGCDKNPLTKKSTLAFIDNSHLFPSSFRLYEEFLSENTVLHGTPEADMVERVGNNIKAAAEKWLGAEGYSDYLKDYQWEFCLIESDEINAWVLPGGKIAVYTGILPVTQTEAGLAVVIGHEIAHALLNHSQQQQSAGILQLLGAIALGIFLSDESPVNQEIAMLAYNLGTQILGTLPFSRKHEEEADHYGLILMAIAGYNPEEAAPFWDRMTETSSNKIPVFLSTHPVSEERARNLEKLVPEALSKAQEFGVTINRLQ